MLSNISHEHKPIIVLSALVLALLALFLACKTWLVFKEARQVGKPTPSEYTISVEGFGTGQVRPDVSRVNFTVETKQPTLPEAQTENANTMNTLIEKLIGAGVEKKDIQTSNYNSYQDQTYDPKTASYKTFGWVVTQSVEITMRDLEKVSTVLTVVGQNGATNISGPNFQVENSEGAIVEARRKALEDLKKKADAISEQLGVKLGPITNYTEWKEEGQVYYGMKAEMMSAPATAIAPTIEPGEDRVKLHVNVSYVIER